MTLAIGSTIGIVSKPLPPIFGDELDNFLFGNGSIYGFAGNDYIYAFNADNKIYAGSGNDTVYTGDGDNHIGLGSGNDYLEAGIGDNEVSGGSGNDTIVVGVELIWATYEALQPDGTTQTMWYSYANERAGGDNIVNAGTGDDVVVAYAGDDKLSGGSGDDYLNGGRGNDKLCGGSGQDSLFGGAGRDILVGGADTDVLYAGVGDTLKMESWSGGADRIRLDTWSDGSVGTVRVFGAQADDTLILHQHQQVEVYENQLHVTDQYGTDMWLVGVGVTSMSIVYDDFGGKG